MSNYQEIIKGGISITWKIENFVSIHQYWLSEFSLEWAKAKIKWQVKITVAIKKANQKSIHLHIYYVDKFCPVYLSGTVIAINGKFSFPMKSFEEYSFHENEYALRMAITPLEGINFEKKGLINNDSLTLCINLWDPNINDLVAAEYFIRSPNTKQMCSFQWSINGDRDWKRNVNYIESSTDIPMEFTDFYTKQNFRLHIVFQIEDSKLFVNILIKDMRVNYPMVFGNYRLKFQRKEEIKLTFFDTEWNRIALISNFCQRNFINEEKWDLLEMECVVKVEIIIGFDVRSFIERICYEPNDQILSRKNTMSNNVQQSNDDLQSSVKSLFNEGKFCDIILCSNSETFPCHKVILCARSSVFQTILANDLVEKVTNTVNIDDVKPRILGMFLAYLHSDKLEVEDFSSAIELYAVADKYAVPSLKKECTNIILSGMSVDNACEVLDLADSHQDDDLKGKITLFFCDHAKEIMNSPCWQKLLSDKPLLALKTTQTILEKLL